MPEALARTIQWERNNPPPVNPAAFDYAAEDAAGGARERGRMDDVTTTSSR